MSFVELALGADRLLLYAGYVLLAGTFTFWVLVWPEGTRDQRLVRMARVGIALMALTVVTGPLVQVLFADRLWGDVLTPLKTGAAVVRLAALAAAAFYLPDIVRAPVTGRRRALPVGIVLVLAGTMVASSNAVGGDFEVGKIVATTGHLLATAAWLGGLTALAAVIIPREYIAELDEMIPRFSVVAATSVAVLVVTGTIHALAVAGGVGALVGSSYGVVFGLKVLVFALMLALGNHGRTFAARAAARAASARAARERAPGDPGAPAVLQEERLKQSEGVGTLAVVLGAETAIALAILMVTSLLVHVAPHA